MKQRDNAQLYQGSTAADILGISTANLRRYAEAYERVYGELSRDRRGRRLYTREAVERIKASRTLVTGRLVPGIEAAFRQLSEGAEASCTLSRSRADHNDHNALLAEELQWLRRIVEDQNQRLAAMEARMLEVLMREHNAVHVQHDSGAGTPTPAQKEPVYRGAGGRSPGPRAASTKRSNSGTPKWRQIMLAAVLAGLMPVTLVHAILLTSFALVGYDINHPPLREIFLGVFYLLQLLPLVFGIWAGLSWQGRHLGRHALLALLAGAIAAIGYGVVVVVSRGWVVVGQEDFFSVIATIILFLAGGAIADSLRTRTLGSAELGAEGERQVGKRTLLFWQYVFPATLTLLGIVTQAIVTLASE